MCKKYGRKSRACGTLCVSMEWLMRKRKEKKFIVPMGKTKICLELFFSICGIKVFIKENSFVHCHTNLHIRRYTKKAFLLTRRYVHDYGGREGRIRFTCLCYNGSWGTDLWPLCRVPPFNNQ